MTDFSTLTHTDVWEGKSDEIIAEEIHTISDVERAMEQLTQQPMGAEPYVHQVADALLVHGLKILAGSELPANRVVTRIEDAFYRVGRWYE